MNKILFLLFLSVFLPLASQSQPPGYLGKRATLLFNFSSFPAFEGPTQNNRGISFSTERFGESEQGLAFNYEFNLDFSYVVSRMRSLSLGVGQYYTGVVTDTRTRSRPTLLEPNPSSAEDFHSLFNRLNVRSITLMYHKFKGEKGALAPIGNQFSYGLKYLSINSEIVDKRTSYRLSGGSFFGHEPLNLPNKTSFLLFKMAFKDHFVIKMGIQVGVPLHYRYWEAVSNGKEVLYDTGDKENQYYDFRVPVLRRIFFHELLRFDFGVGFLLF